MIRYPQAFFEVSLTNFNLLLKLTKDAGEKFKLNLPEHNIIQYTVPFDSKGLPIHYTNNDKYNLILNTLIDMYYLTYSTDFIPSITSSISRLVCAMREHNNIFNS